MFNRKKFIEELDRFEVTNNRDLKEDEIKAIIDECKTDEDPLYLAVNFGFQCGCMKAGEVHE